MSLEDLRSLHPDFADDVLDDAWDFERSVELRSTEGGTSRSAVQEQVGKMNAWLATAQSAAATRAAEEEQVRVLAHADVHEPVLLQVPPQTPC